MSKKNIKINIAFCFLLTLSVTVYGQDADQLKYTLNEKNVVASAIDGDWKSVKLGNEISFQKDTTVLSIIPKKHYKFLGDKIIYQTGYMFIDNKSGDKMKTLFVLTERNGNPYLVYYRDSRGVAYGNGDAFIVFIATAEERSEDRLFLSAERNTFIEFKRMD